jgi:hypothetical protein
MKKILLFVIVILSGCATLDDIPGSTSIMVIDFSKYSKEGFLITPDETFLDEYNSIGLFNISLFPRAKKLGYENITPELRKMYLINGEWAIDPISTNDVIDTVYSRCKAMGADAVINFKLETDCRDYPGIKI